VLTEPSPFRDDVHRFTAPPTCARGSGLGTPHRESRTVVHRGHPQTNKLQAGPLGRRSSAVQRHTTYDCEISAYKLRIESRRGNNIALPRRASLSHGWSTTGLRDGHIRALATVMWRVSTPAATSARGRALSEPPNHRLWSSALFDPRVCHRTAPCHVAGRRDDRPPDHPACPTYLRHHGLGAHNHIILLFPPARATAFVGPAHVRPFVRCPVRALLCPVAYPTLPARRPQSQQTMVANV